MIKYKAIISDCDGTLIQNGRNGFPSSRVKASITSAQAHVHVGVATSRNLSLITPIANELNLRGPSVVHGGALIYDFSTSTSYYQYPLPHESLKKIYEITATLGYALVVDTNEKHFTMDRNTSLSRSIFGAYTINLTENDATALKTTVESTVDIEVFLLPAWNPGKFDVGFSAKKATKQHGVNHVAEILGITPSEIIGVGDGQNDLPLLMGCGLKIAMGNAVPELKSIADYIAPSVEDDGIVDIIEKFILQTV